MNSKQLLVLLLVVAIVGEEASAHTPLSMIKWVGHWVTKPIRAITGLPLLAAKTHFVTKAVAAKKLALIKAGLVAKPLLVKAAVLGVAAHHGKAFLARTTPAPIARTTRLPLIRQILPQRISFPEVIVPVRLSLESGKANQQRISQVQERIPTKV